MKSTVNDTILFEVEELMHCVSEQELKIKTTAFFARELDNCDSLDVYFEEQGRASNPCFFEYCDNTFETDRDNTMLRLFPSSVDKVDKLLDKFAEMYGEHSNEYRAIEDLYKTALDLGIKTGYIYSMLTDD